MRNIVRNDYVTITVDIDEEDRIDRTEVEKELDLACENEEEEAIDNF